MARDKDRAIPGRGSGAPAPSASGDTSAASRAFEEYAIAVHEGSDAESLRDAINANIHSGEGTSTLTALKRRLGMQSLTLFEHDGEAPEADCNGNGGRWFWRPTACEGTDSRRLPPSK